MASNPTSGAQQLPILYDSIVPLSSEAHANFGYEQRSNLELVRGVHAVPLPIDEFPVAQWNFPIIFADGERPVPLALMGLREGSNLFVNSAGQFPEGCYIPAYVRRYPFMLVRLNPDSDELTLCIDDKCPEIGDGKGQLFFDGGEQSETTQNIMKFCEEFEQSVFRTGQFVDELEALDLLMDGEIAIQIPGREDPIMYRGFKMVSEDKLKELRGDQVRKMVQNGVMALIYAHLLSIGQIRELFARDQGLVGEAVPTDAERPDVMVPPSA